LTALTIRKNCLLNSRWDLSYGTTYKDKYLSVVNSKVFRFSKVAWPQVFQVKLNQLFLRMREDYVPYIFHFKYTLDAKSVTLS